MDEADERPRLEAVSVIQKEFSEQRLSKKGNTSSATLRQQIMPSPCLRHSGRRDVFYTAQEIARVKNVVAVMN